MSDEEADLTRAIVDQQALQLVVAQLLEDRFAAAAEPVTAHRDFADQIRARLDSAMASRKMGVSDRAHLFLVHRAIDRLMDLVEAGLERRSRPN